ncbi:MAG: DEAD/DEAH box helicase family protein [Deltaproteobacteria bacterium]|nr:DEAD/DEAH box helicase family protein [Deltaproteobacteria bacterium]
MALPSEIAPGARVRHANRLWEVIRIEGKDEEAKITLWNEKDGPKTGYIKELFIEYVQTPIDLLKARHFFSSKVFDVLTKAAKFSVAYEYDRFISVSNSRTKLEPYQLDAVLRAITSLRNRFLLADDVGLGKSVEAGLIFKELEARGRANRVLIVVPASLIPQWQREMYEKFGVEFYHADRGFIKTMGHYTSEEESPWEKWPYIVTSIDFMKQFTQNETRLKKWRAVAAKIEDRKKKLNKEELGAEDIAALVTEFPEIMEKGFMKFVDKYNKGKIAKHFEGLGKVRWDLIIIDEAHYCDKVTGSKGEAKGNARSRLADSLSERCDSLLLLTATPHNGDPMSLYSLIELLDPFLFGSVDEMRQNPERIREVMIRRGKMGLLDPDGQPIFTKREVQTLAVENWANPEKEFYEKASHYLQGGYTSADFLSGKKRRNLTFAMTILQKRMASSITAITLSVERRIQTLRRRSYAISSADQQQINELGKNELDLTDDEKEDIERKLEGIPIHESLAQIEEEIDDLEKLHHMASNLKTDAKWHSLRTYLRGLFKENPNEKVIIFTEYRDTLNDLKEKLRSDMPWLSSDEVKRAKKPTVIKGFSSLGALLDQQKREDASVRVSLPFEKAVSIIRGGMTQKERVKAEEQFLHNDCRILLATDAASEGLNLQKKCHILINYELPWNPNRLEQRIGRVHRYGQKKDVTIFNLLNLATREGEILRRLQEKIEEIRNALGSVGEVLGCVTKANIEEAIRKSVKENVPTEITAAEIDRAIEEGRRICQRFQEIGLTRLQQFDNTALKKILGLVDKNKELEEDWKNGRFFQQIMSIFFNTPVSPRKTTGEFRLQVPPELRSLVRQDRYDSVVFDKDHPLLDENRSTVFLGFGHPLIKEAFRKILHEDHKGMGKASLKVLREAKEVGLLMNYRYRIESEGIRFDPETGEVESGMETLMEEIVPVFVSDDSCSLQDAEAFNKYGGLKVDFPEDVISPFSAKIDMWLRKSEQKVKERIVKKRELIKQERLQKISIRKEDLNRYWKGMNDLYEKRIEKYKMEESWGMDRKAPLGRAKRELEDLNARVGRQRKILEAMCNIYDYSPEIINAAWIIPNDLVSRS